jgi:sucrose-6-phosphate hydrolase SacC (GH32 family)
MPTRTASDHLSDFPPSLRAQAEADPQRPVCHFRPPAGWMNDPNGTLYHEGWYHCFYQATPDRAAEGPKSWGHARSRDLVDWEHLPIALHPDATAGEDGVWSGGALVAADGTPWFAYTAFPHPDAAGRRRFRQVAVRADAALSRFVRRPRRPAGGAGALS